MCLAIMAPVSLLICVKEWRKSTNTFDLKCANVLEHKISRSLTALCSRYYQSLHPFNIFCPFYLNVKMLESPTGVRHHLDPLVCDELTAAHAQLPDSGAGAGEGAQP